MASNKAGSGKGAAATALPSASDLTPFAHGAAGHEGISSNASGSLVIKPCTQAEIAFYESAKDHPEFQAHLPTFLGSLTLNKDPKVQELAANLEGGNTGVAASTKTAAAAAAAAEEGISADNANANPNPNPNPNPSEEQKEWVPSGGKQLSTGLAIVLENAAAGFTHPNVLDLKLGARLWDDAAPTAKRQKLDQVAAETTSGSLGFRVAGMKVWLEGTTDDGTSAQINTDVKDGYRSFNKVYGRNLTDDTVIEAFIRVVGGTTSSSSSSLSPSSPSSPSSSTETKDKPTFQFKRKQAILLLTKLLHEVQSIRYVLEKEESRMYSASILVVIEGDDDALELGLIREQQQQQQQRRNTTDDGDGDDNDNEEEDDEEEEEEIGPKTLEVRLIDFAHASWTPGQGPDQNALQGVKNIEKIVKGLLNSAS